MDARKEKSIAGMSRYLLKGWVLTDEYCDDPHCRLPLMRTKDKSKYICVVCEEEEPRAKQSSAGAQLDASDENVTSTPSSSSVVNGTSTPADAESERRQKMDKISASIAQRMLQGWSMLGETCPREECMGTVLVRSREKKTLCVSCGTFYVLEKDQADITWSSFSNPTTTNLTASASAPAKGSLPAPAQPASSNEVSDERKRKLNAESSSAVDSAASASIAKKSVPSPDRADKTNTGSSSSASKVEDENEDGELDSMLVDAEISTAEKAVMRKLVTSARQLETTSNVADSIQLCELISSCARTIASLKSIPK